MVFHTIHVFRGGQCANHALLLARAKSLGPGQREKKVIKKFCEYHIYNYPVDKSTRRISKEMAKGLRVIIQI
jgi:hypothetical protein